MLNLVSLESPRANKYQGTGRFIDDLGAISDTNKFFKTSKNIYPR